MIETQASEALNVPATPAYVYSERALNATARQAATIAARAGCGLLYTLKACAIAQVLDTLAPFVHGFAASSVFEARIAASVMEPRHSLHCYSPAFSEADIEAALSLSDYLSLNSLTQLDAAARSNAGAASLGLRINPEISFVADSRYDPSRPGSKLGAPLSGLDKLARIPDAVEGAHIHNNCESDDLSELSSSVEALSTLLGRIDSLRWVNLGGGYYLAADTDTEPLERSARWLRSEFGVEAFIEPGTGLVQQAGFLVSETLDVFRYGSADIAILDTTTSHLPEVFEYEYIQETSRPTSDAGNRTNLVGRSCLAGDIFGEYRFAEPVRAGDRIAFKNAGAYSHSRAAPFNGIATPSVYILRADGAFDLVATYGYDDFAARNGAIPIAAH